MLIFVQFQSEQNVVASFDRKGEHIYIGNAKGKVIRIHDSLFFVLFFSMSVFIDICRRVCKRILSKH